MANSGCLAACNAKRKDKRGAVEEVLQAAAWCASLCLEESALQGMACAACAERPCPILPHRAGEGSGLGRVW